MKRFYRTLALVLTTAVLTAILYEPVSILRFKASEPYFRCLIKVPKGTVRIRNVFNGGGGFGSKRKGGRGHSGIDILAPVETPVYASKSGIAFCLNVPSGYGKYVLIYHPDGTESFYAHLSDWKTQSAKKVNRGALIGLVGKTGNASSGSIEPHLHFEIRKDNIPRDPAGLMRQ